MVKSFAFTAVHLFNYLTFKDKMTAKLKILFFGDIVGKLGRKAVGDYLKELKEQGIAPDFAIANAENASHGFGLTERNYNELTETLDCLTSGNHIWDKREIFNYIDKAEKLVRPINYPKKTPGVGSRVFEVGDVKIAVINALGRVFMPPIDSQWEIIEKEVKKLKKITPIILIDFHAEATAEKVCFAKFCSALGVTAVFGTHTHIQTSDEKIMNNMGYITDVGFCGVAESVIGMEFQTSLKRLTTGLPERYELPESKVIQINAVELLINTDGDKAGEALEIKRILSEIDYNNRMEV